MSVQLETSQAAILDRLIQPSLADWPPAAAQAILAFRFDESDRKRMNSFLEKAREAELSSEESAVLGNYRHIGKLLELMKSRARRSLITK